MIGDRRADLDGRSDPEKLALAAEAHQLELQGRAAEAAAVIARGLSPGDDDLPATDHDLARKAVGFLARAGETRAAARLLVRLPGDVAIATAGEAGQGVGTAAAALAEAGRPELALRLRSWLGHHQAAARLARQLGRHREAGLLFQRAGLPVEACHSYRDAGDRPAAIEALLALEPTDTAYRSACVTAIRLAHEEDDISFALDRFLAPFTRALPHDHGERDALTLLADLCLRHGLKDNARTTVDALRAADPEHPIAARIEQAFAGNHAPPDAHAELPDLPDLPPAPRLLDPEELLPVAGGRPMSGVFSVGTLVEGRYELVERIGRGGTSAIFKALDTVLGDHIALKAFLQAIPDENMDRRIRRELKMARGLTHPNIVRVHELGSQQGFRYITMELLEGTDLRDKMRDDLPGARGIDYLIQVCDGLAAAHAQGIVHRDVKPENCFVTRSDVVKLLDFGIAKIVAAPGATMSGAILGTPTYISPEQITDYSFVTHKADMYSLGVVAYEMFAGAPPFGPAEPMALLRMHMEDTPRSPRALQPSIPVPLEQTILRLLEKEPARRHEDFGELKAELASIRALLI